MLTLPRDILRMRNLAPDGSNAIIDCSPCQRYQNRPGPELVNHRTSIERLYAIGAAWHPGANASAAEAYKCYKIVATGLGPGKPWAEPGKKEPDSLVAELHAVKNKLAANS